MEIRKDKLYTAREAADLLGVTEDTVKGYCRAKRLVGKRVGPKGRWHVPGQEILRLRKEWSLD